MSDRVTEMWDAVGFWGVLVGILLVVIVMPVTCSVMHSNHNDHHLSCKRQCIAKGGTRAVDTPELGCLCTPGGPPPVPPGEL